MQGKKGQQRKTTLTLLWKNSKIRLTNMLDSQWGAGVCRCASERPCSVPEAITQILHDPPANWRLPSYWHRLSWCKQEKGNEKLWPGFEPGRLPYHTTVSSTDTAHSPHPPLPPSLPPTTTAQPFLPEHKLTVLLSFMKAIQTLTLAKVIQAKDEHQQPHACK